MGIRRDRGIRRKTFVEIIKKELPVKIKSMEIGVAAGDFSIYLLHSLDIKVHYLIDPWKDEGDLERSQWFSGNNKAEESYEFVKNRFENFPVMIIREFSNDFLKREIIQDNTDYDLIYVDGDHHSNSVYQDLSLSYKLLKKGGILSGDDYNWVSSTTNKKEVKRGVEMFEEEINRKFNIVKGDDNGLDQYWIKK
jgi:hypothetical protein